MKQLMGVINLDGEQDLLRELTYFRCGASVPFAGRYRLIDFVLSNMVNERIHDVAVFTRQKYRSLMDHLGTGKPWELDRKRGGLFILPPDWHDPTDLSQGELQHFHNNRDFFLRGSAEHVLITGSQFICNINYKEVFNQHLSTNSDVTIIYHNTRKMEPEFHSEQKLEFNKGGRLERITTDVSNPNLYMKMYIIRKDVLLKLVDYCIARNNQHLLLDGVLANLSKLKVSCYAYEGYLAVINSIDSYYKHSMSILDKSVYKKLFLNRNPIYTKIKDEPPTHFSKEAIVHQSIIANGCLIEGTVENSILFRGVHVHKDAVIRNSIVMQRCDIHQGTILENMILDKDILLSPKRTFIGAKEQPYIIAKRKVI
ncbi:glucose-1-phosphate adenylyltransferase subunit GlgD [Bacillus solitudinis]|uniref:glucose-1-phosphate adenylyltransferase subunit GlgD n=1 Tax=Bacillus solitudinis TaxID=2014074 RepID=UPI000C232A8D|nr:glucose-1-phosphate adenylyltransferase subunit GlgD [Bacillus solitudinis]